VLQAGESPPLDDSVGFRRFASVENAYSRDVCVVPHRKPHLRGGETVVLVVNFFDDRRRKVGPTSP
jgi:hypothetical protein